MYRAILRTRATDAAFAVLLALCSFANGEDVAWPSLRTLEKRARKTRPTVIAAIRKLVVLGEIEIVHSLEGADVRRRKGEQVKRAYRLLVVKPFDHQGGKTAFGEVVKSPSETPSGSLFSEQVSNNRRAARAVSSQGTHRPPNQNPYDGWMCPHQPTCSHPVRCRQQIDIAAAKRR
jgi:hypothetical protein